MKCPLGYKFSICQDSNGYFLGVKKNTNVLCRISEYATLEREVLQQPLLITPNYIGCPDGKNCIGGDELLCQKNGQS